METIQNYLICKESFTFENGKITTLTTKPLFRKNEKYLYIIENDEFIWIKSDNANTYGPGTRITYDKKQNDITSKYFHNIKTSNRDIKIKNLLKHKL